MKSIKIIDDGHDRYSLLIPDNCLGRMYDNNAESIVVEKPASEANSVCTMIVTYMDTVVDHINVGNEPIPIRSNISQYESIRIGFAFTRADGYTKNTDVKKCKFEEAQKPDDFVAVQPEQQISIEYLLQFGFSKVEKQGTRLTFLNVDGEVVSTIDMATFSQVQADMAEEDEENVSFIKNKSTRHLKNEGEDGTSPFATEKYVEEHGGKINKLFVNGEEVAPDEAKSIYLSIITKAVDDLINYYKKTEIDGKFNEIRALLSAVPKFNIKVVDMLPMENIDSFTIYLLRSSDPSVSDLFTEFIYVNAGWECLGSQKIDLSEYPKFSDLAKIATTGKLADAVSDEQHRTVKDEEKSYWNNKANKSEIPTDIAQLSGFEAVPSKAWIINKITEAGESLASGALNDIINGTYLLDIQRLENVPTDLRIASGAPLYTLKSKLAGITAHNDFYTTEPAIIDGEAVFENEKRVISEVGVHTVEIVFIPAIKGWYYYYTTIQVECYDPDATE